jgi:Na+/H+-dicarboxylate symporter
MITIIGWVVLAAPVGIFALSLSVGARLGVAAAGAIIVYILACIVCLSAALALLYVMTSRIAGVPLRVLAPALLPAQTIAFTSRSSLAALPVLLSDAPKRLGMSPTVAGFVLPLCASIFKPNSPITWPLGAVLVAQLYGLEFAGTHLIVFAVGCVILSLTVPGIPSGGFFVQAPLYLAVGLPPEGLGILIAVDFIPDLFKTLLNLTSYGCTGLLVQTWTEGSAGPVPRAES